MPPPVLPGAAPLTVSTRYRSRRNPERRKRPATRLIILHTTEAPARSALRHLSERGECHYCVAEDGTIYQIVDVWRVAFHAGLSMWNGKEEVDNFSVGIECVGYHDKTMPAAQLQAIGTLVRTLQARYGIPDECVLTHSQVAYGDPNKWQKKKHRGRKRCGMMFATPPWRKAIGLTERAAYDPDVRARRLVVGDPYLHGVLYGGACGAGGRAPAKTAGKAKARKSAAGSPLPPAIAPRTAAGKPKAAPSKAAPKGKTAPKPVPPKPSPAFKSPPQTVAELRRDGFVKTGTLGPSQTPIKVAGKSWNSPDTYYENKGKVVPGNVIDPRKARPGTNVWKKKQSSR